MIWRIKKETKFTMNKYEWKIERLCREHEIETEYMMQHQRQQQQQQQQFGLVCNIRNRLYYTYHMNPFREFRKKGTQLKHTDDRKCIFVIQGQK